MKIAIVNRGPLEVVSLALATIMFSQSYSQRGQRLDFCARPVARFCTRETVHQLVDVFQLVQRGPATITTAPLRTWREPDREGFSEVFRRVRLRVPRRQVQHEFAALGFWLVEVGIGLRKRSEE